MEGNTLEFELGKHSAGSLREIPTQAEVRMGWLVELFKCMQLQEGVCALCLSIKVHLIFFFLLPSRISGFNRRFIIGLNYHLLKATIFCVDMSDGNV